MTRSYLAYLHQLWRYGRQKASGWLVRLARHALTAAPIARQLDLPEKQYRVEIGHPGRVAILLAGCGGTGSFAAHILAQLAAWAATTGMDLRLYFVDPDVVEEKNLVRQNFCRAELGAPKAFTLAWRYSAAFGITIVPVVGRFSAEMLIKYQPTRPANGATLMIVVGAVDNVCARRDIAEAITARLTGRRGYVSPHERLWWLDSGNERVHGQILIGNSLEPEPLLSPLGFCTGLPLPHLQDPTLLMERTRPLQQAQEASQDRLADDPLSCAELTALGEQSAMINRMMAAWLGVYLFRLLQSRDLTTMSTFINARTMVVRSTPITGGRVVLPEPPPQRLPVSPPPEANGRQEGVTETITCPECGAGAILGQDELWGVLVSTCFCTHCQWREQSCPDCGGELEVEEIELETTEVVPGLCCADCGWQRPIPAQYRAQVQGQAPES